MKTKRDWSQYPQICIRTNESTVRWLRNRAAIEGITIGEILNQLRSQDDKREIANAAKRSKRAKK